MIVIVDGSTDGTCELLDMLQLPYPLTWHRQDQKGRAAACNAGLARARGAIVVFLDDDMEPTERFVTAHASSHPDGSRRAVIGAAPIAIRAGDPTVVRYVGNKFNRHLERLNSPGHRFALRDVYSGNLSIRREILSEVGGFDEAFRVYGHEDLELAWRLRASGVEFSFNPDACASQHYEKDFSALAHDNVGKGRTAVMLAGKHPAVAPELKLATAGQGSAPRRLLLRALIAATGVWPSLFGAVAYLAERLGDRRPANVERIYEIALDYFFLLGARAARRETAGASEVRR